MDPGRLGVHDHPEDVGCPVGGVLPAVPDRLQARSQLDRDLLGFDPDGQLTDPKAPAPRPDVGAQPPVQIPNEVVAQEGIEVDVAAPGIGQKLLAHADLDGLLQVLDVHLRGLCRHAARAAGRSASNSSCSRGVSP
ncbi:hypothetical protein BN12_30065 [Nostocoides japonicum T1-X7]|uniref:Uncharacterized protein n=1 Tax=Nostocoides japonicum T1-X7 TaxID=1194083 RepID=A0A077M2U1_9MICO|nr:hypothetical protein BN12_30065 [Tetrasphaera japonica T1-X7]